MKSLHAPLLLLCLFLGVIHVQAQDIQADATKVAPVPVTTTNLDNATTDEEDDEETSPLEITGGIDAYYQANFNGIDLYDSPYATSFTPEHGGFTLGMANVIFSKDAGKVGFVADLAFGPRAEAANGGEGTLSAIKQLYMTYAASDKITLTLGNFSTFVGYELIDATGNINYSTSYLFSNGPFYHTGLKADVTLNDHFGAMVGIFNDTDDKLDVIGGKHLGAQLSATFGDLSAYLNFITGKEEERGENDLMEYELDLTATYDVSARFMLGLNVARYQTSMNGRQEGGFYGSALYATITTSETFALGLRGEYFAYDTVSDAVDDPSIVALTASGNITLGALRLIPEFRIDLGSEDMFLMEDEGLTASRPVFLVAAVYAF